MRPRLHEFALFQNRAYKGRAGRALEALSPALSKGLPCNRVQRSARAGTEWRTRFIAPSRQNFKRALQPSTAAGSLW